MPFSLGHLPLIRTPSGPQYVRAFRAHAFKKLKGEMENVALRGSIASIARRLKTNEALLKSIGFSESGINLETLDKALEKVVPAGLNIQLRSSDPRPGAEGYLDAVKTALVARFGDPKIVLREFDIYDVMQRDDLDDNEKALVTKAYSLFQLKELGSTAEDIVSLAQLVVTISRQFTPKARFTEAPLYWERWYFITLVARYLYPEADDARWKESIEAKKKEFTEKAIAELSLKCTPTFSTTQALIWIEKNLV